MPLSCSLLFYLALGYTIEELLLVFVEFIAVVAYVFVGPVFLFEKFDFYYPALAVWFLEGLELDLFIF